MKRLSVALILGLMFSLLNVAPAGATVSKGEVQYQQWLDQTAVTASVNGVVTTYTERQVGMPAYQELKHQQFIGGVSTQTVFWTCPSGIGCYWPDINGGGAWRQNVPASIFYGQGCFDINTDATNNKASSMSADYGGGLGLKLWEQAACLGGTWVVVWPSHAVNFTGTLSYFNDVASSFKIVAL